MANTPGSHRPQKTSRPAGTRFRTDAPASHGLSSAKRPAGTRFASSAGAPARQPQPQPAASAYRQSKSSRRSASPVPVILGVLLAIAVVAGVAVFVFPKMFSDAGSSVEAGQTVELTIPDGASGDVIASLLSEAHVVEDPAEYYAAVKKLGAEMSLRPGMYEFKTHQDPAEVVKLLVAGPNASGSTLTVPEGKTVAQTAKLVEDALGIPAAEFIAQAKASLYVEDYPFLADVANDSLEGFLFPKTYAFSSDLSADDVIRAMLDQYEKDVIGAVDFAGARAEISQRYGLDLSDYELLTLASVVEREGLNADQRSHVASVFFNRLAGKGDFEGRPYLESDATLMYETGGEVTATDIETSNSPYNSYKNSGLPPTPICSPSVEAILSTLRPTDSNDLYFFITQTEEYFSETYDEHMQSWE
ncbi:MAG: endolytic transglycosylase MltG [Coriobacteriaceae bacterium]|nr:endolytic transglycosylase MltG [Coriobacteriaceae bacterium]